MTQSSVLKIYEIFRSRKIASTFFILTNRELHKVNQKMYVKILQGYVYKNDTIRIISEDEGSGIEFEVVEEEIDEEDMLYDYNDYIYTKYNLLPFLTDTLPYQNKIIDILPDSVTPKLTGRILYKTRINNTTASQYLFFILKINDELIKAIVWKENLKYSSLNVGDCVAITKFRVGKGYPAQGHIEFNEFSEMAFFNIKEISINEMYKLEDIGPETSLKIENEPEFYNISGFISYRSVLNRRHHHGYSEYYLLNVDNKQVMLFYNSDLDFYDIEAGNKIEINNLRRIQRKKSTIFVSTIFTQFKYENIAEYDEFCSSFLYETPIKRKNDEIDEDIKRKKRKDSVANMTNEDMTHSMDEGTVMLNLEIITPEPKNNDNKNLAQEIYKIKNETLSIPSNEHKICSKQSGNSCRENEGNVSNEKNFIDGAYGFLPDSIFQDDEKAIVIDNKNISATPFFVPKKIRLEDLEECANKLVINESDKFIVEVKILDVVDLRESNGYCVNYIDTNCIKKQFPLTVQVENDFSFYIFDNFFTGEKNDLHDKIYDCIGKECNVIIHLFKATIDHVIFSISDIQIK
ncbi:uncharacterized protein VNE69_03335 [Vairimorpha necatrix]|uniref:Uncharacterized protein n=1 Tax=Vairimorpha necatrix TaxID=6039 RepID=A0AAX4JAZ2_9MICR